MVNRCTKCTTFPIVYTKLLNQLVDLLKLHMPSHRLVEAFAERTSLPSLMPSKSLLQMPILGSTHHNPSSSLGFLLATTTSYYRINLGHFASSSASTTMPTSWICLSSIRHHLHSTLLTYQCITCPIASFLLKHTWSDSQEEEADVATTSN